MDAGQAAHARTPAGLAGMSGIPKRGRRFKAGMPGRGATFI
jgi:hypothetical protein